MEQRGKNPPLKTLLIALIVGAFCTSLAKATPSNDDARDYAKKMLAAKWSRCGSRYFAWGELDALVEMNGPMWVVQQSDLSDADRLNGFDYIGYVTLTFKASRTFNTASRTWNYWENGGNMFADRVLHQNGEWRLQVSTEHKNLDCSMVEATESGAAQNVVLIREYQSQRFAECFLPKGTKVRDQGPLIGQTPFDEPAEAIIPPPGSCPQLGRDKAMAVPISVISHARDKTVYPPWKVTVHKSGFDFRSPVLCTVTANTPVVAVSIEETQPGIYMAKSYIGDLCSNFDPSTVSRIGNDWNMAQFTATLAPQ